ncbi:MAG: DUF1573 domain-containing protein [Alistipes sp.]|nr:DUF1573 domain-containing protein [Alistipes sp.]MBQ2729015.1 DUF1573 domain-containing protein [Alistipes sp.]MBQ3083124.1 DUF1573 domain-containing protein [Alistipes sp.]MBQ7297003.1 DUF1573 domain-containing protein [Alistipes sp.]MBQ8470915.1 DUF1573 domain-containing protein [Alistipes sp.]
MKRLLLLLFVALLPWVAEADRKGGDVPSGKALLRLEEHVHNFGDVPHRGGELVYEFRFTNSGTAPLVLTRVVTTCSCLKAHFNRRPVAPGESAGIRIVYEPHKSEPGVFNKVIQIYSNSAEGREVITVQGNALESEKVKVKADKVKIKN